MTAYVLLALVGAALIALRVWGGSAERRKTRAFQKSGRKAARHRHPAGKRRADEWDIYIPPSAEVATTSGLYNQDDPDLRNLEAAWDLPDARREVES